MLCCPNRIILTDVDDTILSFSTAIQNWVLARGIPMVKDIHEASSVEDALGLDFDTAYPIVIDFLNSPEFGKIEPEPCAAQVLPELHRAGYRIVAITACQPSETTIRLRHQNLQEAFGFEFEEVFMTGFTDPRAKRPYLERYQPTVWVEDNWKHAVAGAEIGHNCLVINRSVNHGRHDDRIRRVTDWHEIEKLL